MWVYEAIHKSAISSTKCLFVSNKVQLQAATEKKTFVWACNLSEMSS